MVAVVPVTVSPGTADIAPSATVPVALPTGCTWTATCSVWPG